MASGMDSLSNTVAFDIGRFWTDVPCMKHEGHAVQTCCQRCCACVLQFRLGLDLLQVRMEIFVHGEGGCMDIVFGRPLIHCTEQALSWVLDRASEFLERLILSMQL